MFIQFDRDNCKNLLVYIGENRQLTIRWFRDCPFGWCRLYEPYSEMCPLCHDVGEIPWYRGWLFQFRQWWALGPGYRIWEWREKRREREQ